MQGMWGKSVLVSTKKLSYYARAFIPDNFINSVEQTAVVVMSTFLAWSYVMEFPPAGNVPHGPAHPRVGTVLSCILPIPRRFTLLYDVTAPVSVPFDFCCLTPIQSEFTVIVSSGAPDTPKQLLCSPRYEFSLWIESELVRHTYEQ